MVEDERLMTKKELDEADAKKTQLAETTPKVLSKYDMESSKCKPPLCTSEQVCEWKICV